MEAQTAQIANPNSLSGRKLNIEITKNTLIKQLPKWTKYAYENVKILQRKAEKKGTSIRYYSIENIRPEFAFLPALIVGYGNSFHETVDMIKEIPRDKCKIIACDRSLGKLASNGVIPDLVTNLDAGTENIKPFYFYDTSKPKPYPPINITERERSKMSIAVALTADPTHFQWFHGRKYFYVPSITAWGNNLTEDLYNLTHFPKVPSAGNVGTTSIIISKILGSTPPYIIGIDFGRRTYKDKPNLDAPATDQKINSGRQNEVTIDCGNGVSIVTDTILRAYAMATRDLLVCYDLDVRNVGAGLLHGPWIKTINPTPDEGGSSRERMDNFIKFIKETKIPPEIHDLRARLKAGEHMVFAGNSFCPQPRKFAPHEKELLALRKDIEAHQNMCRAVKMESLTENAAFEELMGRGKTDVVE